MKRFYNWIWTSKSPGKDGLTKEFYETFWEEIKILSYDSITKSYQNRELGTSQKKAAIKNKVLEKKDKNKKLIQNLRPIFLLNVDTKRISIFLAERHKNVLPF